MVRYCKSCGSVSKAQIPLFIVFIAAFIEKSVFLSFYIAQTYIPTDTPDHFTPLRACAARGNNIICAIISTPNQKGDETT